MGVFVKFGDIEGDATLAEHEQWCEATSFNWSGASNSTTTRAGAARHQGLYYDFAKISKKVDSATAPLLHCFSVRMQGDQLSLVKVHLTNAGNSTAGNISLEIILKQARVTGFEYNFVDGSEIETITLDFAEYEMTRFDAEIGAGEYSMTGVVYSGSD